VILVVLVAGSLAVLLALITLASLVGAGGLRSVPAPEGLRELVVPAAPAPAPRDSWAPVEAGLRHLGRSHRGRDAETLRRIYGQRDFRPFWVTPNSLGEGGRSLLAYLAGPSPERLRSEERRLTEIGHLLDLAYPDPHETRIHAVPELEWALSSAFLHRANHLLEGRRPSARARESWNIRDRSPDLAQVFGRAASLGASETLRDLGRLHEPYTSLRRALAYYQTIEHAGGWIAIEEGATLETGDRSERVLALRRRLRATGDLRVPSQSQRFDAGLEAAVRRFQERHGLNPDGRVGNKTLAALNVPVQERVRQLEINLERRRWLPASLGEDFVWVNIPEFRLRAFRGGKAVLDMPVVVGAPSTPTPSFEDEIEMAVLNPYWNVPESIALGEIAPRAATDPDYLERASFEILDSRGSLVSPENLRAADLREGRQRIRRKPGPANDLGRIKFLFPNEYRVYLHDTPSRHLFDRDKRAFSHGCIRLGRPMELARHLFPELFRDAAPELQVSGRRERVVRLAEPVPIYIVYFTAWRADEGMVHFREDIYGHDAVLWSGLRGDRAVETEGSALGLFSSDFD
jgi:murein L,D-transpeptidase YcbB/YkuD